MAAEACRRRGSDRATEDHASQHPPRKAFTVSSRRCRYSWPPRLHADTLRLLSVYKSGAGHSGTIGEEWTVADRQGLSGMA
eukprot:23091-Hanusia_phi.AAC.1